MLKKLRNKLSNQKGSSVLEFAIGLIIFVMIAAFAFDLFFIGQKKFHISTYTTKTARILGVQGGVTTATPQGFPGGDTQYLTSSELTDYIQRAMDGIHIKDYTVTLKEFDKSGNIVKQTTLGNGTDFQVDYRNTLEINIDATYQWSAMKYISGGILDKSSVGASRNATSEFKYNFDEWDGEAYD